MTGEEKRLKRLGSTLKRLERETGESFSGGSFSSRLRIQKSLYLLQALGYRPAKEHRFSNYIKGPYSPDLAKDYYALAEEGLDLPPADIPESMLRVVVDANNRDLRFLEAVTTLHSIWRYNRATRDSVLSHVKKLKPHLSKRLEEAWEFLEEANLVPQDTSTQNS